MSFAAVARQTVDRRRWPLRLCRLTLHKPHTIMAKDEAICPVASRVRALWTMRLLHVMHIMAALGRRLRRELGMAQMNLGESLRTI
jgi:hypothetical protein